MDEARFWELIEQARAHVSAETSRILKELQTLVENETLEEIFGFHKHCLEAMRRAYTSHLWAACDTIEGGCGDDTFSDFRSWLIVQGQEIFEQAIRDPDMLIALAEQIQAHGSRLENITSVAVGAYKAVTGSNERYPDFLFQPPSIEFDWDDEESLKRIVPKLFDRFYNSWKI